MDKELEEEFLAIRKDFKFFENNTKAVYLDSAAMTQKPQKVLNDVIDYYNKRCSNVGRSISKLDIANRTFVENLRKKVISFLQLENLNKKYITRFTHNTTRAMEIVANNVYKSFKDGDKVNILFSEEEHISTIKHWKMLEKNKKEICNRNIEIKLHTFGLDNGGYYEEEKIKEIVRKIPKDEKIILILTSVHPVSGMDMDVTLILKENRDIRDDIFVVIDASQQIRNMRIEYSAGYEPDIIVFGGSKMYALEGVSAIVADNNIKLLTEYNDLKDGTINMGSIVSLDSSIEYLEGIGIEKIKKYILELNNYLILSLKKLNEEYKRPIVTILTRDMCAVCSNMSLGIVSFKVEGIDSLEIAQILSDNSIYLRENNDCMNIQKNSIRISLGIYNTKDDIDTCIHILKKVIEYYI